MNIIDAANATVHDYPGGSESLGPRVGLPANLLRDKVNPGSDTHLTLAEAERIMALTEDFRMLEVLAHQHGFLLVRAPASCTTISDMDPLERAVGRRVAGNEFVHLEHAAQEGQVDERELRAIRAAEHALRVLAGRLTQSGTCPAD